MSGICQRLSAVVSTQWLAEHLTLPGLRLLDGSWHLPNTKRDAHAEYLESHIPGALFFDIEKCSAESDMPHMLPSPEKFQEYVGKELGIDNETHVVIYDNNDKFGLFSAQRVWWTFRVFGHNLVSMVEGGLPKWIQENHPVTKELKKVEPAVFKAQFKSHLVKSFEDVEKNLEDKSFQLVDARPSGRFQGIAPEPRDDIKPGCIPNSFNVPFMDMTNLETRCLKTPGEIKHYFEEAGIDLSKPLVATCGSGISACMVALGAYECGNEDVAVYDGSWTEWYKRAKEEQCKNVPKD